MKNTPSQKEIPTGTGITQTLPLVLTNKKVRLIIPEEVIHKIKFLLKKITVEWSGVVFYTDNNNIEALFNNNADDNFVITLQDIVPLDIGTHSHTSYESDGRVTRFLDRVIEETGKEELEVLLWRQGHIHSHHTMNSAFSAVDNNTLVENGPLFNYYFSLIVNNALNFTAFVAQKVTTESSSSIQYRDSFNALKTIESSEKIEEKILKHPCQIIFEEEEMTLSESFLTAFKDVEEKKKEEEEEEVERKRYSNIYYNRNNESTSNNKKDNYKEQLSLLIGDDESQYDIDPQLESFMIDCLLPDNIKREKVSDLSNLMLFLEYSITSNAAKYNFIKKVLNKIVTEYDQYYGETSVKDHRDIMVDFTDEIRAFEGTLEISDILLPYLENYLKVIDVYPKDQTVKRLFQEINIQSTINTTDKE